VCYFTASVHYGFVVGDIPNRPHVHQRVTGLRLSLFRTDTRNPSVLRYLPSFYTHSSFLTTTTIPLAVATVGATRSSSHSRNMVWEDYIPATVVDPPTPLRSTRPVRCNDPGRSNYASTCEQFWLSPLHHPRLLRPPGSPPLFVVTRSVVPWGRSINLVQLANPPTCCINFGGFASKFRFNPYTEITLGMARAIWPDERQWQTHSTT